MGQGGVYFEPLAFIIIKGVVAPCVIGQPVKVYGNKNIYWVLLSLVCDPNWRRWSVKLHESLQLFVLFHVEVKEVCVINEEDSREGCVAVSHQAP